MNIKFVDVSKDLCETCRLAFQGGCPVYPPLNLVEYCINYVPKNVDKEK